MNLVKKEDIENKRVIMRVDYNVPLNNKGEIIDNSRIVKSLDTINFLINNNAKVILMSHFGRVKEKSDIEKKSLECVAKELSSLITKKIVFIKEINFENVKNQIEETNNDIILLENTRSYDYYDKMESNCNEKLSKFYGSLAEVFINDAFGASHRKHASTYGIKKYLPSFYGFLIDKELRELDPLINIKNSPFTVFMGGAKVEDKLPIIKNLLEKCDYLCLGGGILNSFLKAKDFDIKNSLATDNEEILNEIKILLDKYSDKIMLANNFVWNKEKIYDIDISLYKDVLRKSNIIFINGTPGVFEEVNFQKGTLDLLEICADSKAKVIIGGGDSASAVKKFNLENRFSFISSGGGASLEYISNGKLDALEDL